jgi:hypothetical protein
LCPCLATTPAHRKNQTLEASLKLRFLSISGNFTRIVPINNLMAIAFIFLLGHDPASYESLRTRFCLEEVEQVPGHVHGVALKDRTGPRPWFKLNWIQKIVREVVSKKRYELRKYPFP